MPARPLPALALLALCACPKAPFSGEPPLLEGEGLVERICSDARYQKAPEHARCAPGVEVLRVRVPVHGRAVVMVATRDAREAAVDGPVHYDSFATVDGRRSEFLDELGSLRDLDDATARRLLEAVVLEGHWGRLATEQDLAELAARWPAAAARVRQEPPGFAARDGARVLRWWEAPPIEARGARCRQLGRNEVAIDAEGHLQHGQELLYGEALPGRQPPATPQGCGKPLPAGP